MSGQGWVFGGEVVGVAAVALVVAAMRLIIDMRDDVACTALEAGMSREQFTSWVTDHSLEDLTRLPYLGTMCGATHARLRNVGDTWNSHDLNDMLYLGCAGAYSDIVVCEKEVAEEYRAVGAFFE